MNFASTKERILQYIEFKGIGLKKFFEETGIKRGFLDTDKLNSSVSDEFLTKIIVKYSELNLYWLITGTGEMILNKTEINNFNEPGAIYELEKKTNPDQKKLIEVLEREILDLKEDKKFLQNIINNGLEPKNKKAG